jgi:hypothetical protein
MLLVFGLQHGPSTQPSGLPSAANSAANTASRRLQWETERRSRIAVPSVWLQVKEFIDLMDAPTKG